MTDGTDAPLSEELLALWKREAETGFDVFGNRTLRQLRLLREIERLQGEKQFIGIPPAVAGRFNRTLADFERSCLISIGDEQLRTNPDNYLIGVLCDAVRLAREQRPPGSAERDLAALREKAKALVAKIDSSLEGSSMLYWGWAVEFDALKAEVSK